MKRYTSILSGAILLAISLFLGSCGGGSRQRLALEELERQNRADSLMTNDSLALSLADWFDGHGTANEQLRAHYILGRTYADLGEAPQAIDAYNEAADRADTTASDCDYYTLCRVYSQMAELFYQQNLITDNLRCLDKSIEYAYMAGDTIAALNSYGQKIVAFDLQNNPDSVIQCSSKIKVLPDLYYQYLSIVCNAYIKLSDLQNARICMKTYEEKSGYFDSLGNIERGREAYYHIKGCYYSAIGKLDSAELYYRKELQNGRDYNNQNMAARSLSLLFQTQNKADSAAKYGLYSYQMVDSVYMRMSTRTVARMQAMHDYSKNEKIALQKTREADRLRFTFIILFALCIILVLVCVLIYVRHKNEKRLLDEKIRILSGYAVNERLRESSVARRFRQFLKTSPCHYPELHDWKELKALVDSEIPSFHDMLNGNGHALNDIENDICLMIKIQLSSSEMARIKQCAPSYITQIRRNIYQKIFQKKGRAEELDEYIMSL